MKQYESPVVQQVDDITEGIYVASGASPTPVPTPIPTEPPAGEWNYSNAEWRGHNGGSHSEGHIDLHYSGPGQTVQGVEVNCITNFDFEMDQFWTDAAPVRLQLPLPEALPSAESIPVC